MSLNGDKMQLIPEMFSQGTVQDTSSSTPTMVHHVFMDFHIMFKCWPTDTLSLFLSALVLDLVLVAVVKAVVRRRRPAHNRMDMFATFSVDRYSFPSGHATRAAMCARFLLAHLVLAAPLRVLVMLWAVFVGLSRVLLGRHNVTDVAFGFFMGYCQYNLVEVLWLSPATLQNMMGQLE